MRETYYDVCTNQTSKELCDCFKKYYVKSSDNSDPTYFSRNGQVYGNIFDCYSAVLKNKGIEPGDKGDGNADDDIREFHPIIMNSGNCMQCPGQRNINFNSFINLPMKNSVENKVENKVCLNNDTFNKLLSLALKNCS